MTKPPGQGLPPLPPLPKAKDTTPKAPSPSPRRDVPAACRSVFAFQAPMLGGGTFDFGQANASRRLVVYLFNPDEPDAEAATLGAQRLHEQRHDYRLSVVGVVTPPVVRSPEGRLGFRRVSDTTELEASLQRHLRKVGATFPCVLDPSGAITERYLRPVAQILKGGITIFFAFPVQAEGAAGQAVFGAIIKESADPAGAILRQVLKTLGVEALDDQRPLAADHPKAPEIEFADPRGKTHRLTDYRGQVVFLSFIARDCPKCKDQLAHVTELLKSFGKAARPDGPWLEVLVVCTDAAGERLHQFIEERGYAFPVGSDPEWTIRRAYRFLGPVPDTYLIGQDGTVRYHHRSVTPVLNDVLHMEIRSLLGLEPKPLLARAGISGDEACRVCHLRQHSDWQLTRHACAWETLIRIGKQDDPECIRCHVVLTAEPGGFISTQLTPHLANVQCESCHGGNGCKAFTGKPVEPLKAETCQGCHDAKHSPRFDFAAARPRVLHDRAEALAKLSPAGREAQMRRLCSGADRELFPRDIPFIGSAACIKCHPTEGAAMKDDPHTNALALLEKSAPDNWSVPRHKRGVVGIARPECLRCHTTGFGRPGGYPADAGKSEIRNPKSEMGEVGCEACHGPGKAHADDTKKPRAIARLGGTCNECNVFPICRQCHDDDNDPDFDYRTALPKARHAVGKAVTP